MSDAKTVAAAEAGHWYHKDGMPAYTVIGKNGKERPATLRDARALGLLPSVTTIIGTAYRPGLEMWKIDQAILAALTLPGIERGTSDDLLARIKADAKKQAELARKKGTLIHGWIESHFRGQPCHSVRASAYVVSVLNTLSECKGKTFIAEKSFASFRYGGQVDLCNNDYLIDIKTTDKPLDTIRTWDEHAQQLAAYDMGMPKTAAYNIGMTPGGRKCGILMGMPKTAAYNIGMTPGGRKCGILYVNTITAESKLIWVSNKEIERGWKCFIALLDYWYAKTGL